MIANDNRRPMSDLGKMLFDLAQNGIRAQFPKKPTITHPIKRPSRKEE